MKSFNLLSKLLIVCTFAFISFKAMAVSPSGSLPVLYVNTENSEEITSKEYYLKGTYYLVTNGAEGIDAIGSAEEPLPLQIKCRGNYTWWGFDKKPFRLKLDKKASLMGLKSSKHFVLLAHADDELGFLRDAIGFQLSRRLNLAWTPADQPIELVINGDYRGLYFLTENIRVDSNRVNITEQNDGETDPEAITGGWLVEIDNYDTDPHVSFDGIVWTYKSPEELSSEQEAYLLAQGNNLDNLICNSDKTSDEIANYLDLTEAARYYVVQEIMDDTESYHGSCYLYKDRGSDSKWKFGPVWDFGNAFRRGEKQLHVWDLPAFSQVWIGDLFKFQAFKEALKEVWQQFTAQGYDDILEYIDTYANHIAQAAVNDAQRWPSYGNANMDEKRLQMRNYVSKSIAWLEREWSNLPGDPATPIGQVYLRGSFNDWSSHDPFTLADDGTHVIESIDISGQFKIADAYWASVNYGAESADNKIVPGEPFPLTFDGANINVDQLSNVKVVFDPEAKTVTITEPTSVEAVADAPALSITGRVVSCPTPFTIYSAAGYPIWRGTGSSAELLPGFYIVSTAAGSQKIAVR